MKRQPIDIYDEFPSEMMAYLRNYGWHFNKKAYEFAVSLMKTRTKERAKPITREEFNEMLKKYSVTLDNDTLYDGMYVLSMAKSDCYQSSLPSEQYLAMHVKDVVDDVDAGDGSIFVKWYACCMHNGLPIDWSDLL